MRLFVGVQPPEDVRRKIIRFMKKQLSGLNAKLVEFENLHITLKFIGEVPNDKVPEIKRALETIRFSPFTVELFGIGGFPTSTRARVVWIGTKGGAEELTELATRIEDVLEPLGIPKELRPFHPHLTLARVRGSTNVTNIPAEYFGSFVVEEFILFKSVLTPSGPIYTPLLRVRAEE